MICDRRQGQHDSTAQCAGHIRHWTTMAGSDAITAGYYKVYLPQADIGAFICQSDGRVILSHRSSFLKAISDVLIQNQLSRYPGDLYRQAPCV